MVPIILSAALAPLTPLFRHEHIYSEELNERLLRSDKLPKDEREMRCWLGRTRVVVCTLSMLSSPRLEQAGLFKLVPVTKFVVDEASQINIGELMVQLPNCPIALVADSI